RLIDDQRAHRPPPRSASIVTVSSSFKCRWGGELPARRRTGGWDECDSSLASSPAAALLPPSRRGSPCPRRVRCRRAPARALAAPPQASVPGYRPPPEGRDNQGVKIVSVMT